MVIKSKTKKNFSKNTYIDALKNTLNFFGISNNIGTYSLKEGSVNITENDGVWKVSCIERSKELYCLYYKNENEACKGVLKLYSESKFKFWILSLFYIHKLR